MSVISTGVLSTTTLETFRSRAAGYDRENRFFQEDFDDLRQTGYLRMAVPKEFGGLSFSLADVARETRRLASYAPATALGMNMHNYWVGVASELWRNGDRSCEWILREAAAGEVFAAGHAESGNETSVVMSITKAERLQVHGPEVLRQPDSCLDPAGPPRARYKRPCCAQGRPRLPSA